MHQVLRCFNPALLALLFAAGSADANGQVSAGERVVGTSTVSVSAAVGQPSGNNETLMNRYTAVSLQPSLADLDPTKIVVQVNFPRINTKTVGDAVRYLLVRTGYDLIDETQLKPQVVALLGKRLPDSQRTLGPFHVDTMLKILVGPAFEVHTNHASRQILFYPVGDVLPTSAGGLVEHHRVPSGQAQLVN